MCTVLWCSLSWEAFATLITALVSLVAVGGAIYVGQMQVKISARQTEIMGEQSKLHTLALRSELFERRYAIYSCIRDFVQENKQLRPSDQRDREKVRAVIETIEKGRFLFTKQQMNSAEEILATLEAYGLAISGLDVHHVTSSNLDEVQYLLDEVEKKLDKLADRMGSEMILYFDDPASISPQR